MSWSTLRTVLGYGAVAAAVLVCLRIVSLGGLLTDWGRELATGVITLVAVVVGMWVARDSARQAPVAEPDPVGVTAGLTPRERQVLVLLDGGLTNKELAAQLGVSENTVKRHLANLYGKLGVGRRTEALAEARRRRILGG